jgi:PAS domain-containing protein
MFRYADISSINPSTPDFVRRKRHGSVLYAFLFYLSLLIILLGYGFYQNYHSKDVILIILITVGISILILHALYTIQKSLDMIMAVEFQNALFTSALNIRMDFTIIMQRNGSIVYVDRGFRDMFPQVRAIDDRVLDYLVTNLRLDERSKEKFFMALRNYDYEQLVAEIFRADGQFDRYMLYLSPIPRPQGYFMIQARRYVDSRNAIDVNVEPIPQIIPNMHHTYSLLDALPDPAYLLSESGALKTCNQLFVEMLGFPTRKALLESIRDLGTIIRQSGLLIRSNAPIPFQGNAEISSQSGDVFSVYLQQNIIRESGRVMGALGIISKTS